MFCLKITLEHYVNQYLFCVLMESEGFWENVIRYPRYMISLILGIFFSLFELIKPLFKNPVTSVALVGLMIGGFAFLYFTLRAMLGLSTV